MSESALLSAVFVLQATGAALVSVILFATARAYGRAFLQAWAVSWAALALFAASSYPALQWVALSPLGPPVAGEQWVLAIASKAVQVVWLLIGVEMLGRRTALHRRRALAWTIAAIVGSVAIWIATTPVPPRWQPLSRLGLVQAASAVAFWWSAWQMGRLASARWGIGGWLLAPAFAVYGLTEARDIVVAAVRAMTGVTSLPVLWAGLAEIFLHVGTCVSAIAVLLEEESAERVVSADRALEARAALSESERRQQLVLDHIDEVIWSAIPRRSPEDPAMRITWLSGRVRDIVGLEPDEIVSQPSLLGSLVHPDDRSRIDEAWARISASRLPGWYDYRLRRRDSGEYCWIEDRVTPQVDADGQLTNVFGVSRDVTERKRAEEALRRSEEQARQSQKMEAVGRLAGGIAHDFNNLLTVISGHADLLLEAMAEDDPRRPDVKAIEKASERATALARQLLAFSRRQILHPQVLDLRHLLDDIHGMLTRLIGEEIRLTTAVEPGVGFVRADRSQMEQVLLNLVVNARDAMPDGGAMVVEVRATGRRDEPVLERLGAPMGEYVMLAVHDTGVGIDVATRARLFEPFFTTKAPGKGTGLGLATVYGIVRQSGGYIDVRSEVGRGASFAVYLPRADQEAELPPVSRPSAERMRARSDRWVVLVVEDEDAVRNFVVTALRSRGHVVIEAANGESALSLAWSHPGRIDLMLTDVIMPGMRGSELAARLLGARPDVRVAFMTGYTDDATWRAAQATGHLVIAKPFTTEALLGAVREAIEGVPPTRARVFVAELASEA